MGMDSLTFHHPYLHSAVREFTYRYICVLSTGTSTTYLCVLSSFILFTVRELTYRYHLPLCPLFLSTLRCQGVYQQVPPTSVSPLLQCTSLPRSSPTGTSTTYLCVPSSSILFTVREFIYR
jgi:hypothetical protein